MKKPENEVRNLVLKVRINAVEKTQLKKLQKQSTERSLSNYVRKVALQKPVTITYRNQSADDFLKDMLDLRKQLNGIGNNFNQAVHKLHTLDRIPDFREWIREQQAAQKQIVQSIETIRLRMNQLYEQWLQK
ncbi:MAG: plasmid mobilization relaxosome protein MobC [Chitinophagaceae bacterium]|nr:plasmid mobilization relaxosome protein MobC [Chitinophagaceae bacterium]